MIFLFNYLNPQILLLVLIFVYSFLLLIIFMKKKIYHKSSLNEFNNNPELLLDYIDKYYIKNKYVTFSLILFYFMFKICFVLYLRYLYLGYEIQITTYLLKIPNFSFFSILKIFLFFTIFVILIRVFYILLNKIFFDEFVKIYIYCLENKILCIFTKYLVFSYAKNVWGPFCLVVDCVYRKTPTPDHFFYNEYYIYENIYENDLIKKTTLNLIKLSKKYKIVYLLVVVCRKIFYVLYKHFNHENINKNLPIFLLIITFLYDFFNGSIYYSYYILFLLYFINIFNNLYMFIFNIDPVLKTKLYTFFYKNSIEYSQQRNFRNGNLILSVNTKENISLLYSLKVTRIIKHIYNDFNDEQEYNNKEKMITLRFYIMMLLSVLTTYVIYLIYNNKISSNLHWIIFISIMIIIWSLTIFYGKNVYVSKKENLQDYNFYEYNYNKKYDMIFWFLIIIQCYFFWKILFKPEIMLLNNEILFQLPFDTWKILKIYTKDDKIIYLFQCFENNLHTFDPINHEYLRHILRQLDFNSLITSDNNLSLQDIQVYMKLLIENLEILQIFQNLCNISYLESFEQLLFENMIEKSNSQELIDGLILSFSLYIFFYFIKYYK